MNRRLPATFEGPSPQGLPNPSEMWLPSGQPEVQKCLPTKWLPVIFWLKYKEKHQSNKISFICHHRHVYLQPLVHLEIENHRAGHVVTP